MVGMHKQISFQLFIRLIITDDDIN